MPTPTVPYSLMVNPPPTLASGDHGPTVTANFKIAWSDAFSFYDSILGYRTGSSYGGPTTISEPWRWPPNPKLIAMSCKITPITIPKNPTPGTNQGLAAGEFFSDAKAEVVFGTAGPSGGGAGNYSEIDDPMSFMQFDPGNPITLCTCDVDYSVQFENYDGGFFRWSNIDGGSEAGKDVPFRVGKRLVRAKLLAYFPQVPYLPWQKIKPYLGCVNWQSVFGAGVGQVMFDGFATKNEVTSAGVRNKGVTLAFQYSSRDWNKFMQKSGNVATVVDWLNKPVYEYKDLREIFI